MRLYFNVGDIVEADLILFNCALVEDFSRDVLGREIDALGAGLVLTRATIAPFGLLAPLWLVWHRRTRAGVVCGLVLLATVMPWVVRNYLALGYATLSTEAGLEFWTGNNGFLFRYYPRQSSDISKAYAFGRLTPDDRQKLDRIATSEAETSRFARIWRHLTGCRVPGEASSSILRIFSHLDL
jgi:hypothetical protein